MKKSKIVEIGTKLLKKHGLEDWIIIVGDLETYFINPVFAGCNHEYKEIRVNRDFIGTMIEKDVRRAILHEIVHAVTKSPDKAQEFRDMCEKINAPLTQDEIMSPRRRQEFIKSFWGIN